jgi:hypothetical protein
MKSDNYEKKNGSEGMCFAIKVEENLSNDRFILNNETPFIHVKMYSEGKDGLSPSQVLENG